MVSDTADWPWSSYAAMTGLQECPAWLQTDWILGQFGDDRSEAVARYVNFVRAGVGSPSVWDNVQGQVFLGSESFHKRMLGLSEKATISEIPRTQRRPPGRSLGLRGRYELRGRYPFLNAAHHLLLITPRADTRLDLVKDIKQAKMAMVAKRYEMGKVSSGMAAQMAGLVRVEFLLLLGQYDVAMIDLDKEELQADLENA
jgi:predicted HTH domain antitoxin